jgi:hypothetical protein
VGGKMGFKKSGKLKKCFCMLVQASLL